MTPTHYWRRCPFLVTVLAGSLAAATTAHGAGFALIEQSVKGQGNAFAGAAAVAEDPSTVYYNPAGLTRLEGTQFSAGFHVVAPSIEFSDAGSADTLGTPLSGGDGGDAGETRAIPNLYYARDLGGVKFGLGVNAPFGLATDYNSGWKGRYHALESELKAVSIMPSLAFRVNEALSLGIGLNVMYAEATLTNAVDFGLICTQPPFNTACGVPQGNDGKVDIEGDDWGFGVNLGVLYELDADTRIGVAYRSKVNQELDGDADFTVPASANTATGGAIGGVFADTGATAVLDLPESVSVSLAHQLDPKWQLLADVTWTKWDRFQELRIEFDNPRKSDTVVEEDWDNSFRYSVGANYDHSDAWTFRGGIAYDETPIPSAQRRTARIPGNDRTWVSLGASYRPSDTLSLDVAYSHLFSSTANINNTDSSGHTLTGEYESDTDIVAAQALWKF